MTAETAVALPVLALTLAAALWAIGVVGAQLQCVDAARAGARAAARGETVDAVRALVLRVAPKGADVEVSVGPEVTRVDVSASVQPLGRSPLPSMKVTASAASATENGVFP